MVLNLGGITGAILMAPVINRFGPYRPIATMVAGGCHPGRADGAGSGSLALTMALLFESAFA